MREYPGKVLYEDLKSLRDDVRLKLHLAGMDLRDVWRVLERRVTSELRAEAIRLRASLEALREQIIKRN